MEVEWLNESHENEVEKKYYIDVRDTHTHTHTTENQSVKRICMKCYVCASEYDFV